MIFFEQCCDQFVVQFCSPVFSHRCVAQCTLHEFAFSRSCRSGWSSVTLTHLRAHPGGLEPKIAEWVMNDIGDISSLVNVGSRSTRVDPKLFGKPSDFSGDRREWRHFEWVFVIGLVSFTTQLRTGWIRQQVQLGSLEKRSRRKLCKEYGATTGTSLHEYTNLLEYDFGTTDGFKKTVEVGKSDC